MGDVIGGLAGAFAQVLTQSTAPTVPSDISLPVLIGQIGLSSVFLWLYLRAEKERREATAMATSTVANANAQQIALMERLIPILEEATSTLERVQGSMARQVDRAERSTSSDDVASAARDLRRVLEDIGRRFPPPSHGS